MIRTLLAPLLALAALSASAPATAQPLVRLDVVDRDTSPSEVAPPPPVEPSIMKRLISGLRRSLGA